MHNNDPHITKVASTSWFGNFLSMAGVELSQLPHVLNLIPRDECELDVASLNGSGQLVEDVLLLADVTKAVALELSHKLTIVDVIAAVDV